MQAIRSYIALICPAQHTAKTPPYTLCVYVSVRLPACVYVYIYNIIRVLYI